MSASRQLDQYLDSFRQRLRKLTILQGAAASACVLLVLAVAGAYFSRESGFAQGTVNLFRLLLVLGLAATVLRFLVLPLRQLKDHFSSQVEGRAPAFKGRIQTYAQMEADNPFRDLLAEDALKVSDSQPVTEQVPGRELNYAALVATAASLALVYLLVAGPGMLNFGLRNLFAGWAVDGLLPPQSIAVTPGDQSIRRGANLRIVATPQGFDPDALNLYVRNGDRDWQEVTMVSGPAGHEFTFFSMQENMSYYLSAPGVRTPEFQVQVVDVPSIESISLTYHYPEWTKREAETIERGGDIRVLPETRVGMTVTTSAPMNEGQLVLNQSPQTLSLDGNQASTEFLVEEEGEYYLAALVGGEAVRISDDFFIRLAEDGRPEIEIVRPGQDWNASNIEEVLVQVDAKDDYGLESVELFYSINGGEWQSIVLAGDENREVSLEHLFMLEDMRTPATSRARRSGTQVGRFDLVLPGAEEEADAAEAQVEPELVPLVPGDIVSYYAQASDRNQVERSDMFFIQIQPFNRRYTQSQMSGGGGGGGGGPQDEISQRQRQIIVSTWNLIREQEEKTDDPTIRINSSLLSDLQETLAQQAQTLADRTRARQLNQDPEIERFVQSMEQAVEAMHPASDYLASVELNDALQPAQEALQHLLRAEAVFNDITLSQQQDGGGGGGGGRAADLAEMFELEMDMEKNQYETGSSASTPRAQAQEEDDIMKKLEELARRQEQLANAMRNQQQLTDAQKYQQDMLRREAERLQERLDQLERNRGQQQQQASNQQGQQGQQQAGQEGQQGGEPQAGEGGEGGQAGDQGQQVAQSELQQRLQSAIRAMNEAAEGMRNAGSQEELQRAAEEARRQLEGARDQVAQEQRASLQQAFDNMASQGERLLREQQRMERQLQEAMERAVAERESGEDPASRGMTRLEEFELADEKQRLSSDLQTLQQQMQTAMQRFDRDAPDAVSELQRANNQMSDNELQRTIAESALYIESGYGLYIAGGESGVTAGIRRLAESLDRAQQLAGSSADGSRDSNLDRARQQAQNLRNQMQQQLAEAQQGGQGQQQDQDQQQGQQGEGQQEGGQAGGGGNAGGRNFGPFGGPRTGSWDAPMDPNQDIPLPENFSGSLEELAQVVRSALPELNLGTEDLARMYDMIRELEQNGGSRNDSILTQEFNEMLALVEQVEVRLRRDTNRRSTVRSPASGEIPDEYKDSVAEYYRRLSE